MATSLWVRLIRNARIEQQTTVPCTAKTVKTSLEDACHTLDLPVPIWLRKNENDWRAYQQTRFLQDHFMETIEFDRMEIELIDPDAKKKRSKDPRNM